VGRHLQRPMGPASSAAGWIGDRLPPALQGRVRLRLPHLVVVASLLLVTLGVTGWWLSRPGGAGAPLPVVATPDTELVPLARSPARSPAQSPVGSPSGTPVGSLAGAPSGPAGVAPPPGAAPTGRIVVDVAGRVRRPGIATLPVGSRVVDALHAAGGPRHGVRLGSLNLARVLTDGEQILVGVSAPPGVAASSASAPTSGWAGAPPMVNINSASQTELEELPDVGPVTAQAIVEYRTENGAFTSVDQLLDVSGIGDATLAKVAPFVTL
jgi:competence protein ComEA